MQAAVSGNFIAAVPFRGDYWQQSRRPLASLAFVTPLLAIYEFGILWLGPQAMRNGADVWLRQWLDGIGFSQYFLLPLLTLGMLLACHYTARDPWRVSPSILYAKWAECLLLALVLVVIARVQGTLLSMFMPADNSWAVHATIGESVEGLFQRFVSFMGAGIYEELLFRLLLLPSIASVLRWCGMPLGWSLAGGAILSSLLFSGAHHLGAQGELFEWYPFVFRTVAGLFFSVLFIYRGFGIVAGTHAIYDILVGLM
ncbi:MAG: CPBP family intramembrane metalloprotease [Pirellulales bacterium]|nr:CPBP family intramembrane metalloprotease [Pirellulales bacterium]